VSRVLPDDVVQAYYQTGLIPIRLAWNTDDGRGGCAMDALAYHQGIPLKELRESLPEGYEDGFVLAWDDDDPRRNEVVAVVKASEDELFKVGFCDGLLCRSAVENTFSSSGINPVSNES
jgi:hypothetical protein